MNDVGTKAVPTDYTEYGGSVVRWAVPDEGYPDCSCGCVWFDRIDSEYGTCYKPFGPREGMLTHEHQAGKECFEGPE